MYYLITENGVVSEQVTLESIQVVMNYRLSLEELEKRVDKDIEVLKGLKLVTRHNFKFKEVKSPFKDGDSSIKRVRTSSFIDNGYDDFINFLNLVYELETTKRHTRPNR